MAQSRRPARSVALAVRVFALITSPMPRRYRERYRADTIRLMNRLAEDAHRRHGAAGVLYVFAAAVLDFVRWMLSQFLYGRRHGTPDGGPNLRTRSHVAGDNLRRDVRHACRTLIRQPGPTLVIVCTLAVGVGLNAAVFAVVDWVLLRPLPYPASHQLVRVFTAGEGQLTGDVNLSPADFQSFSAAHTFRACAGISSTTRVMAGAGMEPAHVVVARVIGDPFTTLGAYPQIGRPFTIDEMATGAPVLVIGDGLWRRGFSGNPQAVGQTVTIDGVTHTVVGVMPRSSQYPADADVWRPLTGHEREDDDRDLVMIGRLNPGARADRASLELATLAAGTRTGRTAWVEDLQQTQSRNVRLALTALFGSAALLLLVATANVAALIAARSAERAGEIAIRGALGASRGRIFRQILTETALLGAAGGAAGLWLGHWALGFLIASAPAELPRLDEIVLDARILIAGSMTTLVIAGLVGVIPAARASRLDMRTALMGGSARIARRTRGRHVLVAAQAAMAVVLAVSAALLGRSLHYLVTIDHGFVPEGLLAVRLDPVAGAASSSARRFPDLIKAAETVPSVKSAAVALRLPTQILSIRTRVQVVGEPRSNPPTAVLRPVTPKYFETVRVPVLSGRDFNHADRQLAPRVAIVNTAFVREIARRDPLGLRLTLITVDADVAVIGVVGNITPGNQPDRPAVYVPEEQMPIGQGHLLVRTSIEPESVIPTLRSRLQVIASEFALDHIEDLSATLAAGRASSRFNTQVASAFAGLALLLAAIGLYGLTAAEVTNRWRDVGIRLALGASRAEAFWHVVRPGARALVAGVALGLAVAVAAAQWMASLLHGVQPADPPVLIAVPLLLIATGIGAAALAASRMLRSDPSEALRRG